jgi:hypothetical protein
VKYGSLYLADPNLDDHAVVLRINSQHVYYQAVNRRANHNYCMYGLGPGEEEITETTEFFVLNNDFEYPCYMCRKQEFECGGCSRVSSYSG